MNEDKKELKKLLKEYNKICGKLEDLNEQAFGLEQEIHFIQTKIRKEEGEKNENS